MDQCKKYFDHIQEIYRTADRIVSDVIEQHGEDATVLIMSDHGFGNFRRQFGVNTWLRDNGYIGPSKCTSLLNGSIDWSQTRAYSIGLNGIYLNLKGRERDGIVAPGSEAEDLTQELIDKLKAIRDTDGSKVVRNVYRTRDVYQGPHTDKAPDLLVGFYRGYRTSWASTLGTMESEILTDNNSAWMADHCIDPLEVPGVLFSTKPIAKVAPDLTDLAPTILNLFSLETPDSMTGEMIYQ